MTVARCKFCGQPIDWIYSQEEQKNIPVDEEPVFVDLSGGEVKFITDEGGILWGRLARQSALSPGVDVAFLPHRCWRTVYQK